MTGTGSGLCAETTNDGFTRRRQMGYVDTCGAGTTAQTVSKLHALGVGHQGCAGSVRAQSSRHKITQIL
jgi:hypothetical protein